MGPAASGDPTMLARSRANTTMTPAIRPLTTQAIVVTVGAMVDGSSIERVMAAPRPSSARLLSTT